MLYTKLRAVVRSQVQIVVEAARKAPAQPRDLPRVPTRIVGRRSWEPANPVRREGRWV